MSDGSLKLEASFSSINVMKASALALVIEDVAVANAAGCETSTADDGIAIPDRSSHLGYA